MFFTKSTLVSRTRLQRVRQLYVCMYVCMYVCVYACTLRMGGLALWPSSSGCLSPIFFSIQPTDSLPVCSVPFHPRFSLSTSAPLLLFCQYPLHNLFGPLALCYSFLTSIFYQFCCQSNENSAEIFFSNYVICQFLPLPFRCSTLKFQYGQTAFLTVFAIVRPHLYMQ